MPRNEVEWCAFLSDFAEFEKAGIIPEAHKADVEAVRKLLRVKKEWAVGVFRAYQIDNLLKFVKFSSSNLR